jgi:hypothetical protein
MEGQIELAKIIDIDESIASFSKIDNESILPESEANKSFDQGKVDTAHMIESKQIIGDERDPEARLSKISSLKNA